MNSQHYTISTPISIQNILSPQKEIPYPLGSFSSFLSSPTGTLKHISCLNRSTYSEYFIKWNHTTCELLHLVFILGGGIFQGFIHVVAGVSTSFIFIAKHYLIVCWYRILFVCIIHHWMGIWVVSTFNCGEQWGCEHSSKFLLVTYFQFLWV